MTTTVMKPTAVMKPKPMQPRKKTTSTNKFGKKVAMTSSPDDVHATGMTYAELVLIGKKVAMTSSPDDVHATGMTYAELVLIGKKVAMTSSPDDVHATGMTYAELVLMTGSQDTVHSTIPAIVDAKTMMLCCIGSKRFVLRCLPLLGLAPFEDVVPIYCLLSCCQVSHGGVHLDGVQGLVI
jgi:hypothetical protein